jgi:hypothetical protein
MTVRDEGAYKEALAKINTDLEFVSIIEGEAGRCRTVLNYRRALLESKKNKKEAEEACISIINNISINIK